MNTEDPSKIYIYMNWCEVNVNPGIMRSVKMKALMCLCSTGQTMQQMQLKYKKRVWLGGSQYKCVHPWLI